MSLKLMQTPAFHSARLAALPLAAPRGWTDNVEAATNRLCRLWKIRSAQLAEAGLRELAGKASEFAGRCAPIGLMRATGRQAFCNRRRLCPMCYARAYAVRSAEFLFEALPSMEGDPVIVGFRKQRDIAVETSGSTPLWENAAAEAVAVTKRNLLWERRGFPAVNGVALYQLMPVRRRRDGHVVRIIRVGAALRNSRLAENDMRIYRDSAKGRIECRPATIASIAQIVGTYMAYPRGLWQALPEDVAALYNAIDDLDVDESATQSEGRSRKRLRLFTTYGKERKRGTFIGGNEVEASSPLYHVILPPPNIAGSVSCPIYNIRI